MLPGGGDEAPRHREERRQRERLALNLLTKEEMVHLAETRGIGGGEKDRLTSPPTFCRLTHTVATDAAVSVTHCCLG